jgi:hypothetical protein
MPYDFNDDILKIESHELELQLTRDSRKFVLSLKPCYYDMNIQDSSCKKDNVINGEEANSSTQENFAILLTLEDISEKI